MCAYFAQGIPDPPTVVSNIAPGVWLGIMGAIAIACVVLATKWTVGKRDPLPLAVMVGAAVCALNEPVFDTLGKITYAQNNYIAFNAVGRDIPWFLIIGYTPWVGFLPFVIARWIAAGWPKSRLYLVSAGGFASAFTTELANLWLHGWQYYGEPPLKIFGGIAAMASVPLVAGFLLYALAFPTSGWRRLAAGFFVPIFALPMMFAATGMPLYLALYSDLPEFVDYLAVGALLILIAVAVIGVVELADRWRSGGALRFAPAGKLATDHDRKDGRSLMFGSNRTS